MTVSGQFDKGLSRTWSHTSCHKNVSSFHDIYDIYGKTQVLDFPLCWALGSGGRGAVWDLNNGTIVSYFGSNDRFYVLKKKKTYMAMGRYSSTLLLLPMFNFVIHRF